MGNRLEKRTDQGLDGTIDETVKSEFDRNDRILSEAKFLNGQSTASETTAYHWGTLGQLTGTDGVTREAWLGTDQTGKLTIMADTHTLTEMSYDARGRMSGIVITTTNAQGIVSVVKQEFVYDSTGIKIRQTEAADIGGDGVIDSFKATNYVVDALNHTGYAQVLEEHTTEQDADGARTKVITYTIGHDVLTQASAAMEAALAGNGILHFLYDGHGSTRAVANAAGQVMQRYDCDAYGNAVGFNPQAALTNLLYSGEQFNPTSGLQYLRARWYNPQAGRFNRVDPFAGNKNDPQSLHKYAYTHNNPINAIDPSGLFTLVEMMATAMNVQNMYFMASLSGLQNSYFKGMARRGSSNTMWRHDAVALTSLVNAGIPRVIAKEWVRKSSQSLRNMGITAPSHIP